MKNQLKLLLLFLVSFSIEEIIIKKAKNSECNVLALNEFYIQAESDSQLEKDKNFEFEIKGKKNNYTVECSLVGNPNGNQTEIESDNLFEDSTSVPTDSSVSSNSSNPSDSDIFDSSDTSIDSEFYGNIRLLQDSFKIRGSCQITDKVNETETILGKNIFNVKSDIIIKIDKDLEFDIIECVNKVENIKSKLVISFRQLNGFHINEIDNTIIFYFYGMISENLEKGKKIKMDVNLIKNGEVENPPRTAVCLLNNKIIIEDNEPKQGDFSCTIEKIEDINNYNSLILNQSEYISGIPKDNVLLNPVLTEKYIGLGKIKDFSKNNNIKNAPSFNSTSIDNTNCDIDGSFVIKGILTSNLDNDLKFDLPFAYPEDITVTCSIGHGKKNESVEIKCETNDEFKNQKIMIAQTTIIDNNKNELLIITKIEDEKQSTCKNSKTEVITNKLKKPEKISFRQVNQFNPMDKKTKFHFIGISDQVLSPETTLKMFVFIIIKGIKHQKEANCALKSFIPLNSLNPNYGQANFICEVEHDNKPEDLEIISSDRILGINELEDYQISPHETDIKIKETEEEPSLGKVLNFSSTTDFYDIPPTFEISSINLDNCEEKGKIKVEGIFNQKIDKKYDFTIPLSYPPSSMKCTAPIIEANRKVKIDCKVQKEFYNVNNFLIEPRIIKKKHQEVIFIKQYNKNLSENANCSNFNLKQKEIEENKSKNNYTFVQSNNFKPIPGVGLTFLIYIYSLVNHFPETIPIILTTRKKLSNLRNLEESQQETNINCERLADENSVIRGYNCTTTKIKANDASDFESFSLESNEIPGLYEDNSNPILTDNNIKNNIVKNITETKIDTFENPVIDHSYEEEAEKTTKMKSCRNNGTFYINGKLNDKALASLKNFEIHYSNPPDSYCLCSFESSNKMECQNAEAFEEEYIMISNQTLANINGILNFPATKSNGTFTCTISSYSNLETPIINSTEIKNTYFNKKSSSAGLNGGAIAAIVIVCAAVLIGVGVFIALIKNGAILSSKPPIDNSDVPPISNSSANII